MNSKPCARKTCPDTTVNGHTHCSALCRQVDFQSENALDKGDTASMAELSALLGVVDSVNLWRTALMAKSGKVRTSNST